MSYSVVAKLVAGLLLPLSLVSAVQLTTVNYTDPADGTLLRGFLAVPDDVSSANQTGAIVIFPDWDGANDYEIMRAEMIADDLGYVAFAADVYGVENHDPESTDERIALTNMYRENVTLFNGRINAGVQYVRNLTSVDPSLGIAIIGYCFGGTGVVNYAVAGYDDVDAAVAFHGGLSAVEMDINETIRAKVLILSGGDDDTSSTIGEIETTLNNGNGTWELTRYSDVVHGFTNPSAGDAYNKHADLKSFDSMSSFISVAFNQTMLLSNIPQSANTTSVNYTDIDGTNLTGHISYPNGNSSVSNKTYPVVIIIPDFDGVNAYEKTRAQMLASDLGYIGFAADIFGAELQNVTNSTLRSELTDKYRNDIDLFVQRIKAAISTVKSDPLVDDDKIAIIGYCFGGTGVINYAMVGEDEAVAVVSFHGGLSSYAPVGENITISPKMLIQSGGDDDASSSIGGLESAMNAGNATWELTRYANVQHAFTVFEGNRYNLMADARSWRAMTIFLNDTFNDAESTVDTGSNETTVGQEAMKQQSIQDVMKQLPIQEAIKKVSKAQAVVKRIVPF